MSQTERERGIAMLTSEEIRLRLIKLITPTGRIRPIECASECGVSIPTIYAALKGSRPLSPLVRRALTQWLQSLPTAEGA